MEVLNAMEVVVNEGGRGGHERASAFTVSPMPSCYVPPRYHLARPFTDTRDGCHAVSCLNGVLAPVLAGAVFEASAARVPALRLSPTLRVFGHPGGLIAVSTSTGRLWNVMIGWRR